MNWKVEFVNGTNLIKKKFVYNKNTRRVYGKQHETILRSQFKNKPYPLWSKYIFL